MARLSAWGDDGPWAGRRGFDSLVQVATGIAAVEAGPGADAEDAHRSSGGATRGGTPAPCPPRRWTTAPATSWPPRYCAH
ncbi:CoA transferase [Streptomyces lydicus]|nr:CoA transferase [Streptomyces lydicus]